MTHRLALVLLVAALALAGCRPKAPARKRLGGPVTGSVLPSSSTPRPPSPSVERAYAPLSAGMAAALAAPEGATPCDSGYLALKALVDGFRKAAGPDRVLPWERVPAEHEFLAACGALPPAEQPCLAPRYARSHEAVCRPALERIHANPQLAPVLSLVRREGPPKRAPSGEPPH